MSEKVHQNGLFRWFLGIVITSTLAITAWAFNHFENSDIKIMQKNEDQDKQINDLKIAMAAMAYIREDIQEMKTDLKKRLPRVGDAYRE